MSLLAVALAMLAAALAVGAPVSTPGRSPTARVGLIVLGAAAALALAWRLWPRFDAHQIALVTVLASVALAVGRLVRRHRSARAADARADRVLAVCEGVAADLAAGQPPLACLDRVGAEWPEFAPLAAAGRMGADVPGVLRDLAARPGADRLRTVAASWQVAAETGAGLAAAVGLAAESIRHDRRTARLVAAELAAAHATARTLAVLPLAVLLLGTGLGGDPVGFLLGSTAGLGCLAVGLGLSFAGLTWLEKIADRVLGR